ncbi:MAG: BamA/TamA family outer membrane protein [Myxococcota bacterium]
MLRQRRAWSLMLLGSALVLAKPVRAQPTPDPPPASNPAPDSPANPKPAPKVDPPTEAPDTWGGADATPPSAPAPAEASLPSAPPPRAPEPRASAGSCGDCTPARAHDEGSVRYTLESVEVRGNTRTSTRVILRYVRFKAGDLLDVDDPEVQLTRFRLLGTGFFRDVQFSLRKGSERGRVVLVVDVVERNTIVVNDIAMGLAADADAEGHARRLSAYAGLDVAETNLGGTGITLGGAAAVGGSPTNVAPQIALRVRFLDPAFLGSPWMTSGVLLFNDAQDSFGYGRQKWNHPGGPEFADGPAIVRYKRFGGSLGVGRDLSISTQFWATYRLETIDANLPLAASQNRGFLEEPVDFHVVRGRSVLSTLSGTLQLDTRDHPFLPTRGWFVSFRGELSLLPAALDYDYQKFELDASHWWKLPFHDHVLKLAVFAGGISGDAPFFEQFYVGDFSDLLPDRVLGMNFDRRPAPNFLGTDIVEVRYGDYALKLSAEYRIPLYRGRRSIYGIDFFATSGVYGVAGRRDLTEPPSGYSGLARIPLDVTANVGLRMDTSAGGFAFAFSNVLSFVPVRGDGPAGR